MTTPRRGARPDKTRAHPIDHMIDRLIDRSIVADRSDPPPPPGPPDALAATLALRAIVDQLQLAQAGQERRLVLALPDIRMPY